MKFAPQFLDELRTRLPISHVVGAMVQLKKSGSNIKGLCPFHKEKTPSFNVNDEKGFYHCFGCGAGGDVFDFIINTQGLSFPEAVEKVADECSMPMPKYYSEEDAEVQKKDYYPLLEEACSWFESQLATHSGKYAADYIKSRDIPAELVKKFRLGYAPSGNAIKHHLEKKGFEAEDMLAVGLLSKSEERGDTYAKFRNRLIFPIFDRRGRTIAFGGRILGEGQPKYLNSPESPVFHKRRTLYSLNFALQAIKEKEPVIVCEGYMDVIALYKVGYTGAVAPLGTAMGEEQIEELWRSCDDPILCFDGDQAGQQAAVRVSQRAIPILTPGKSLKFATLPKGEDPDTLIKGGNLTTLQELIGTARPLSEIIWQALVTETQPTTPERQALLFKSIGKLTNSIQDTNVRISYQQTFRDLYFKNYRSRNIQKKTAALGSRTKKSFDPMSLQRRILLATVINHPNIINEIFEDFSVFNLPIAEMDNMRHEIIHWVENSNALDMDALRSHLSEQGHKETIDSLLGMDLYVHGKFASPQATDQQALDGWREIFKMMVQMHQTSQDISLTQQELSKEMNESTWNRLRQLKQVSLEDNNID